MPAQPAAQYLSYATVFQDRAVCQPQATPGNGCPSSVEPRCMAPFARRKRGSDKHPRRTTAMFGPGPPHDHAASRTKNIPGGPSIPGCCLVGVPHGVCWHPRGTLLCRGKVHRRLYLHSSTHKSRQAKKQTNDLLRDSHRLRFFPLSLGEFNPHEGGRFRHQLRDFRKLVDESGGRVLFDGGHVGASAGGGEATLAHT